MLSARNGIWWARVSLLTIAAVAAVVSIGTSLTTKIPPAPQLHVGHASTALVDQVESDLRSSGVRISDPVDRMLPVVLYPWQKRADIKNAFSGPDGRVNVHALLTWAGGLPDSSTEGLVPHLGAINELTARMGYLPADRNILPVLFWTLQNEPKLTVDFTGILWHLKELWDGRPEVQARFVADGRVDVVGFLKYAAGLATSDPSFKTFSANFFVIRQTISELERPNT
jgi:hypothetical protein